MRTEGGFKSHQNRREHYRTVQHTPCPPGECKCDPYAHCLELEVSTRTVCAPASHSPSPSQRRFKVAQDKQKNAADTKKQSREERRNSEPSVGPMLRLLDEAMGGPEAPLEHAVSSNTIYR